MGGMEREMLPIFAVSDAARAGHGNCSIVNNQT